MQPQVILIVRFDEIEAVIIPKPLEASQMVVARALCRHPSAVNKIPLALAWGVYGVICHPDWCPTELPAGTPLSFGPELPTPQPKIT